MSDWIEKFIESRQQRFVEIAKEEATPEGYRKYAPVTRGPFINGLMVIFLGLLVPFYLGWRLMLNFLRNMRSNTRLSIAALLLIVFLGGVYSNHFDNAFHFDDMHTIVNNEYIRDIRNIPRFFTDVETGSSLPTNQSYRPVIASLNALDYWLAGKLDSKTFHWHIFLEFLLLLVILFFVVRKVFQASNMGDHPWAAFLTTAFFAFHTATAETINYIIARSDGFSTLMVLTAVLIFVSFSDWRRHLALIPFVVGCFAKPTTLMLAPILATYCLLIESPSLIVADERCGIKTPVWRTLKATWAYFAVGTALYVFTRSMFSDSWTPGGNYSGLQYLNTQAWVILIYLKTFVVPTGLTADTDLEVIRELFAPKVIWGMVVITALLLIGLITARQRKTLPVSFGIFWFFIALVPSSSVIPLAEVMNHHRTFFPYIGLTIATGWSVFLLYSKISEFKKPKFTKTILPLLILGALLAHAWGTFQRNEVWDSGESLWRDVTLKSPKNGRGLMNYGLALMRKGDIEGALDYYQRARSTNYGRHPYLFINMGIATANLAEKRNSEKLRKQAETYFQTALRYGPGFPQTHYRYARWLYSNGKNEAALQSVNRAIELAPANRAALDLKNRIIESEEEQIERLRSEAEIENTPQAFLQLSLEYYRLGRYRDCINSAESALKLRPDYALAYNNICSAHNQLGEYDLAIKTCQKALEIDPDFTRARNNLNHARKLKGLNQ